MTKAENDVEDSLLRGLLRPPWLQEVIEEFEKFLTRNSPDAPGVAERRLFIEAMDKADEAIIAQLREDYDSPVEAMEHPQKVIKTAIKLIPQSEDWTLKCAQEGICAKCGGPLAHKECTV